MYFSDCSLQCGLLSPEQRLFTPLCPSSLKLRSSSLRIFGLDSRTEAKAEQLFFVRLHEDNLKMIRQTFYHIFRTVPLFWNETFDGTYMAVRLALITGKSLKRHSSDLKNLLKSKTSTPSSLVSSTKTRADHCAIESTSIESLPEWRYIWISLTREWSLSSLRQWNRLMDLSGLRPVPSLSFMYVTVFSLPVVMCPICIERWWTKVSLCSCERPRRKRRKRSKCPFFDFKAWFTALLCRSNRDESIQSSPKSVSWTVSLNSSLLGFWVVNQWTWMNKAAIYSWKLRWTKQKTLLWYRPNSSLKIWVQSPEYSDASLTSMPHSIRSSS